MEELWPKEFKISQIDNRFIFYNRFYPINCPMISIYSFNKDISLKLFGKFGNLGKINFVANNFFVPGLTSIEEGYIFAVEPLKFGFTVFKSNGDAMAEFYNTKFKFFKPLKNVDENDLYNQGMMAKKFVTHSRCRYIHYLGKGIVGLSVENPKKKDDKIIPFYYTFWKADGTYLGYLKVGHHIIKGEHGILYYWLEGTAEGEEGFYANARLVKVALWEE